jgi:hypothetical protein
MKWSVIVVDVPKDIKCTGICDGQGDRSPAGASY